MNDLYCIGRTPMSRPRPIFASWMLLVLLPWSGALLAADRVSFDREVRPILADKCFYCHGPDAGHRQAELRLDDRQVAVTKRAIAPGKPEASALVVRIFSADADEIMPPPSANKTLTASEKEILRRWVAEGAEYQGHWAFRAPQAAPLPPASRWAEREVNPIDRFIFARLAAENLEPSSPADPITLIRRVSLDLTGIPPTPEEVEAFAADRSPQAFEKLVDRLLNSPRYGERMALHWLDSARYADSNGFQTDSSRQMWRWRDWVIDAFNRNLPFDQFTIEQLAGDLLPAATLNQRIATGFHRNMRLNGEGGRIVEEWFAETVIDRVDTTGQTWLALTLGCCRCHDHKYDPVTQREYYQLFAFFNSIDETGVLDGGGRGGNSKPTLVVPSAEQSAQEAQLVAAVTALESRVMALEKELPKLQGDWEATFSATLNAAPAAWIPLEPRQVESRGGATLTRLEDGSWLAGGKNPPRDEYVVTAPLAAGKFSGLRLEVLPDASLPKQSFGRAPSGSFVLTELTAEIVSPQLPQPVVVAFARAEADDAKKGYAAKFVLEPAENKGWAVDGDNPELRLPRKIAFVADRMIDVPAEATLVVHLRHNARPPRQNIGRFRLDVSALDPALVSVSGGVSDEIREALKFAPAERSPQQRTMLNRFFRERGDSPFGNAKSELAAAQKRLADFRATLPTTMVMQELPQPRDAFILKRGEYDKPGEKVGRAVPAVLPPLPDGAPRDRLGLALWLTSPEHPLTARVWVNRQWEKFFGTGLVKTVDNFGLQSEPPSHPELLDWLAWQFSHGSAVAGLSAPLAPWDMKGLQKLIVMSAAYRQSSHVSPPLLARDPENRLLARGPRFRLPAELVRDQALAVSGLLVEKVGGPSVRPYMPEGVWDETSKYGDLRGYQADTGDGLYRRTLYTIWKRTAAPPTMLMFDSPSREFCTVKRARTNTPLQALALLNEVTYVEAARVLAERMMTAGGAAPRERIAWGFRRATGRRPDAEELKILLRGFERHTARYAADADGARRLIAQGARPADAALAPQELAAYTLTANVLLNLDEVVTKE